MISGGLNLNRFTIHQILTQDLGMDAAQRQRPMSHGSLHQLIFGRKKAFLWFLSPRIRRISVPVTSFYSPGSKTT
jgi:hypothetical protein